jgi:C1A family cysteine protease
MFRSIINFFKKLFGVKSSEPTFDGWIPDEADARDHIFVAPVTTTKTKALQPSADITAKFGMVESQGNLNSCVGHAVTSALEATLGTSDRSRLFVYYNARAIEWRTASDSGCGIRSAMSAVAKQGASSEILWPYDASKVTVKPGANAYTDGLSVPAKIAAYERVTTLAALKGALSAGLPVVFGFKVHNSFRTQTAYNGIAPYPVAGDAQIGSHAVVAVGFDDATGMVKCRNSFGSSWGQTGYFYMPYTWFANMTTLVSDAWVIRPKA